MKMDKLRRSLSDMKLDKNENSLAEANSMAELKRRNSLMNAASLDESNTYRHGYQYLTHRECMTNGNGVEKFSRGFRYQDVNVDMDSFVHINEWYLHYGCDPCSRTETIYLHSFRSEEPVASNMDISTGHIVLVSTTILLIFF